jgi:hypothetical protein
LLALDCVAHLIILGDELVVLVEGAGQG